MLSLDQAMADDAPIIDEQLRTQGLDEPSDAQTNIAVFTRNERGDRRRRRKSNSLATMERDKGQPKGKRSLEMKVTLAALAAAQRIKH